MNADHANTRYPHLDLGDLIAMAAGQGVADRAKEHLAACDHCQLEANRWNLVSDGVRGLAAAAPQAAQPARRRTRRRVQAPWRRGMIVAGSVAAALVLLVGIGAMTGLVHVHPSGPSTKTALTAVTGCSQIQQADGTLEQVNGSNLVIHTASGRPVIVTTTPSAFVSVSGPLLSDITNGASVRVRGYRSDGTIRAAIVTVGQPFSAVNPTLLVSIQGTVSDSNTAGFTLVTSSGTRVPVTISDRTFVVVPHASPGQLKPGSRIFALGNAGPDGTLSARAVAAVWQLPPGTHVSLSVRDCSTGSIVEALGAIGQASPSS